jgi:acyl-CoA hydrolase
MLYLETKPFHCRLVKPEDLNPANTLFGGRVLEWLDEAAALYAMRTLLTDRIVTKKITEVDFIAPARVGDYLEFFCDVHAVGTTSITIKTEIYKRPVNAIQGWMILSCRIVFVSVNEEGRPTPHRYAKENQT